MLTNKGFMRPGRHTFTASTPRAGTSTSTRVRIEVVTTSGRGAAVEFRVRADTVEVWHREHLAAVLDRHVLTAWLWDPGPPLVVDELTLSIDFQVDRDGRVAITLPDVDAWTLSPTELVTLYRRVVIDPLEDSRV